MAMTENGYDCMYRQLEKLTVAVAKLREALNYKPECRGFDS